MSRWETDGLSDERREAHRRLAWWLEQTTRLLLVLSLVAWLAPAPIGRAAGWSVIVALVAAPVGRLLWFTVRWWDRDRRFVPVALALLWTLALAAGVAIATRG